MDFISNLVVLWGNSIFCHPPNKLQSNSKYSVRILQFFLAIQSLTIFPTVVIFLDTILSNSAYVFAGTSVLSEHIALYIVYSASVIPDFLIRMASLFYNKEQLNVFTRAKNASVFSYDRRKKIVFLAVFALIILFWGVGSIGSIIVTDYSFNFGPEYRLTLIGSNILTLKIVYLLTDLWAVFSFLYAWSFVAIFGVALASRLHHFSMNCEKAATSAKILDNISRNQRCHASIDKTYECLKEEFVVLKEAFQDYTKIAGAYALGLFINCTLNIIAFLSTKIGVNQKMDNYQHNLYYKVLAVSLVPAAILIPTFGNYLTTEVKNHCHRLEYMGMCLDPTRNCQKLASLFNRVSQWKWSFSSLELFEINSTLIPKVLATVLTYFVVLFQLKSTEMEAARGTK